MKISFIGAGNMAEAILGGLLESGLVTGTDVALSDVAADRLKQLVGQHGVTASSSNIKAVAGADVVVLSVKPQVMASVLEDLGPALGPDQLVISIAAGLTTAWLDARLPAGPRLLRVMPNTPALVKEGMSCIAAGPRASDADLALALNIFEAVGQAIVVDEDQMDAVTAVSGSGPAYAFYLMEHMEAAALELGLSPDQARTLVGQTLKGAALLSQGSSDGPDVLRQRVTSKGGTTEAALRTLDERAVGEAVRAALNAAAARSKELSGG